MWVIVDSGGLIATAEEGVTEERTSGTINILYRVIYKE